jgi:hypothetical protein
MRIEELTAAGVQVSKRFREKLNACGWAALDQGALAIVVGL